MLSLPPSLIRCVGAATVQKQEKKKQLQHRQRIILRTCRISFPSAFVASPLLFSSPFLSSPLLLSSLHSSLLALGLLVSPHTRTPIRSIAILSHQIALCPLEETDRGLLVWSPIGGLPFFARSPLVMVHLHGR